MTNKITNEQIARIRKRYMQWLAKPNSEDKNKIIRLFEEHARENDYSLTEQTTFFESPLKSVANADITKSDIDSFIAGKSIQPIKSKVNFDGNHFICVREGDHKPIEKRIYERTHWDDTFNALYEHYIKENKYLTSAQLYELILDNLINDCKYDGQQPASMFVARKLGNISAATAARRRRFHCKSNFVKFNYFATFTYDSKKISSEDEFRKKIKKLFMNLHNRYGWLFAGCFERGGKKSRLHMHCLVYIPKDSPVGEFITTKGYSLEAHKFKEVTQNTYFLKRFGRNEFDAIDCDTRGNVSKAIGYITKYIAKSGERCFYSKGIPTYLVMELFKEDLVTSYCVIVKQRRIKRYVLLDDVLFRHKEQIPTQVLDRCMRL